MFQIRKQYVLKLRLKRKGEMLIMLTGNNAGLGNQKGNLTETPLTVTLYGNHHTKLR